MALDLVSARFAEAGPLPAKRRRLGWDVPDPVLLDEAARLLSAQAFQACPSTQGKQTSGGNGLSSPQKGYSDTEIRDVHGEGEQHDAASAASPPWHADDKDGHFNFDLGENLTARYKILRKMGEGTFGRVLECWDKDSHEVVAIKVVRSADRHREAAMIEIDVLQTLSENDRMGSRGCVRMKRWFDYRNHICIVFEKLGPSLYDFLRANDYHPFSVDLVRDFGRQLLESLAYMHSLSLIHTDLKPENVLLVSSELVKAVDWKGEVLFQTHENLEHLAMMERVLGPFPSRVIRRATGKALKYFRHERRLDWPDRYTSRESIRAVHRLPKLRNLMMKHTDKFAGSIVDLLEQMFSYDPSDRPTAKEALRHPFFQES